MNVEVFESRGMPIISLSMWSTDGAGDAPTGLLQLFTSSESDDMSKGLSTNLSWPTGSTFVNITKSLDSHTTSSQFVYYGFSDSSRLMPMTLSSPSSMVTLASPAML